MNTINSAAAAAREGARASTGQFGEQHRDPAPDGLIDSFVPGNPEYEAVFTTIQSQGHDDDDALDAALADNQVGVDEVVGMLRATFRKGSGTDAGSPEEDNAVNDAVRALFDDEDDLDGALADNNVGVDAVIGMMRETYEAGQHNATSAPTAAAPAPVDLTTHLGVIHAKAAARQAVYEADQAGVRLVAEDITSKFPDAAELLMRTRGDGFYAVKVVDKDGRHVARPDADGQYLIGNDGNEHEFEGELLYETLVDLPTRPPKDEVGHYIPEYAWFSEDAHAAYFSIDLRTALGK
ncbi:hypothetical protein ACWGJ9_10905 [Curtobacterium citreum]